MQKDFDNARDYKGYQRWQLVEKASREAQGRMAVLKDEKERAVKTARLEQRINREADLMKEKELIKKEAVRESKLPNWVRKDRYTDERVRELAERSLEAKNKQKISDIEKSYERKLDRELAREGFICRAGT